MIALYLICGISVAIVLSVVVVAHLAAKDVDSKSDK